MPGVLKYNGRPVPPASPRMSSSVQRRVAATLVEQDILARTTKADQSYRRSGINITVKADSARVDVQRAYQQMYFSAYDDNDSDDGVGSALKRRFRAVSYRLGGQDWEFLFKAYDKDNDGGLSVEEFIQATRRDAQVGNAFLTDAQLEDIFNRIDTDGSGTVSCEEFLKWLGRLEHERDPLRDGAVVPSANGDDDRLRNRVPFVAEYIALQRATLRSGQDISSPKIGMLSTGEVVAVLLVRGRRMKVQRLRHQANPRQGWVSNRTADLKPIMEMLPRAEWTSITGHTTAVAERLALLNSLPLPTRAGPPSIWHTSIFEEGNNMPIQGARNPTDGSKVPTPPLRVDAFVDNALKESEARIDYLARAMERAIEEREAARTAALAKAEMAKTAFEEVRQVSSELERKRLKKLEQDRIAGEELMKCESAAEAKELLDLLENTHRVRWDALMLGKHAEVERIRSHRASLDRDRKKQMLAFSAGVRQARGQKVERETGARERATRASSGLFTTLAGRSDEQRAVDHEAMSTENSCGDTRKATPTEPGTKRSIDRILQKFSPRSGGALHSVAARKDGKVTFPANSVAARESNIAPGHREYE